MPSKKARAKAKKAAASRAAFSDARAPPSVPAKALSGAGQDDLARWLDNLADLRAARRLARNYGNGSDTVSTLDDQRCRALAALPGIFFDSIWQWLQRASTFEPLFAMQTVLVLSVVMLAESRQAEVESGGCWKQLCIAVVVVWCLVALLDILLGPRFHPHTTQWDRLDSTSTELRAWLKATPNKLRAWLVGVRSRLRRGWFVTVHRRELAAGCKAGNYLALVIATPSASPLVQWGSVPLNQLLEHGYYSVQLWERATKAKEEELDAYGSAGSTPLQAARQGLTPAQWGLGRYGAAGGSTPLQAAQRRLAFAALQLTHTGRSSLVQSDDVDVVDLIGEALAALTPFRAYAISWYQEELESSEFHWSPLESNWSPLEFDHHDRRSSIGVFGAHALSPGTEYLMGARPATLDDVQTLVSKIGGRADATLQSFPDRVFIGAEGRHQLQSMLDREHSLRGAWGKHVHDLKLTITRDELLQMISNSELARIEALYCAASQAGGSFNQIKLRRVEAMPGKCIPFHTDVGSTLTMQVPLNDDSEYDGGRLMFATASGIFQPVRPGGSATIHESHVVHGVSQMLGGVRYGLFLLRNTEGAHAGGG
jgi:hypothetical protein